MAAENISKKTTDISDPEATDMEAVTYMRALIEFIFDTWEERHSNPIAPEKSLNLSGESATPILTT